MPALQRRKRRKSRKRFSVIRTKCGNTRRRLPDGRVANGNWNEEQVKLNWNYAGNCNPHYGTRSEISRAKSHRDSFCV